MEAKGVAVRRFGFLCLVVPCVAWGADFGSNLVVNGDFSSGNLNGWITGHQGNCSSTVLNGEAQLYCLAANSSNRARVETVEFGTVSGQFYRVKVGLRWDGFSGGDPNMTSIQVLYRNDTDSGGDTLFSWAATQDGTQSLVAYFRAQDINSRVRVQFNGTNSSLFVDNVEVQAITFEDGSTGVPGSGGNASEGTLQQVAAATAATVISVEAIAQSAVAAASAAELVETSVEGLKGLGRVFSWAASVLAGFLMGARLG